MTHGLCAIRGWTEASARSAGETIARTARDRSARMALGADALWDALGDPSPDRGASARGEALSWVGFYEIAGEGNDQGAEPGRAMLLGPRRDTPACSPIGLHGACGQSFTGKATLVVRDVGALGEGYVACDPRDIAELVIPLIDDAGEAWGVLDADSFARNTFSEDDARVMHGFLLGAGLTAERFDPTRVRLIG